MLSPWRECSIAGCQRAGAARSRRGVGVGLDLGVERGVAPSPAPYPQDTASRLRGTRRAAFDFDLGFDLGDAPNGGASIGGGLDVLNSIPLAISLAGGKSVIFACVVSNILLLFATQPVNGKSPKFI